MDATQQVVRAIQGIGPKSLVLLGIDGPVRERLRLYWDLSVYVETPRDLRMQRMHARGENDPGWIARWAAAEDWYLEHERPAAAADVVVGGC